MVQSCQDKIYKIAIVGAGPSGIYCALNILSKFKKLNFEKSYITIFDKSQALRTILPTGGGRCNITNALYDIQEFVSNYPRGQKFLYSLFSRHFNYDSIEFFNSIGIDTYIQDDFRVFPVSNSSKDVKDKMLNELNKYKNVKIINRNIKTIDDLSGFDRNIIATGSKNVSLLLNTLNQPITQFKPALCALVVKNFNFPQGVSVKSLDGEFVFTDDGISGPLAYKISSLNIDSSFPYNVEINLFDVNYVLDYIKFNTKKSLGNVISEFIPKSLAKVIVNNFNKKASEVSRAELEMLSKLNLDIISTKSNSAIVYSGGVKLDFLDKNCKSKINKNLWFCGEVLDIDGLCGGFNLQNCWSSAYCVACDVVDSIIM